MSDISRNKFLKLLVYSGTGAIFFTLGSYFGDRVPARGNTPSTSDSSPESTPNDLIPIEEATTEPIAPYGWEITMTSGAAEIALAEHLTKIGVKMYGAYWCPHCYEQEQLFGKEAWEKIDYIECAADGKNPQSDLCRKRGIEAFPTWEIKGKL